MPSKTISVNLAAYERLKRAKRDPSESFSEVILRARWDSAPITAGEYLRLVRERGPIFSLEELDAIDAAKREDRPPRDKWAEE
ncbi:MAG TPA: antitoxin VapB family protein [Gemmatimonadales bacterium]|nr:antitoxin VapB family protein [Gemmatimonadales bacterium]